MKIHILGICGTFMGSLAIIAKQLGHQVTGADVNVYPPMSDLLANADIAIVSGFDKDTIQQISPDVVIVGNAISRGNPSLEYVLDNKIPVASGPSWLRQQVLVNRRVVAVSGTHGKTTTTSMVCHILEVNGLNPSFLIGGAANNFQVSARVTASDIFVIEADEYDTSFFDKRAKFVHFFPEIAIANNIEFDHADIYENIDAIINQFHQMVRTIPQSGHLICTQNSDAMQRLLAKGAWCQVHQLENEWHIEKQGLQFLLEKSSGERHLLPVAITGRHNAHNALAALKACTHLGVSLERGIEALASFKGVKRRLELIYQDRGLAVYDDFAHHPTAVSTTLETVRELSTNKGKLYVVLEFGSRSMQLGVHKEALQESLNLADGVYCEAPGNLKWQPTNDWRKLGKKLNVMVDKQALIDALLSTCQQGDTIVILRNTGYDGFDQMLKDALIH